MTDDRCDDKAKEALGKVKEDVGRALGDRKLETEGEADQVAGKVRGAVQDVKDAVRDRDR